MTIAIDCRHINSSGIGVYLRECLPFFLKSAHHFLLLGDVAALRHFQQDAQNAEIVHCTIKSFSLRELFFFPRHILTKINSADTFFSPFFNIPRGITIPVHITIHDIIFPDMPELTSRRGLAVRMWFYRRAHRKSKKIFTVSEFSKSRIEHHLGMGKPVIVTHSAIRPGFIEYRDRVHSAAKKETIVFIGNIKKHKGLDCLIDAFQTAKAEGLPHKLVIIGSRENFRTSDNAILKKIDSIGDTEVSFTGFISDNTLMEHLAGASLLVQPSRYEGFGLPPLEAMVLGTHALISDIPVFREIYSDYPVTFFKTGNAVDLKNHMMRLLYNNLVPYVCLSEKLITKYTFQKTASIILKGIV